MIVGSGAIIHPLMILFLDKLNLPVRKEGCHDDHEEKPDDEKKMKGGGGHH